MYGLKGSKTLTSISSFLTLILGAVAGLGKSELLDEELDDAATSLLFRLYC